MNRTVVIWSDQAWADLDRIFDFVARNSRIEAEKQIFRIIDRGEQLAFNPLSGPVQELINPKYEVRYLVQDNYKILYYFKDETVLVDAVFDTRQDPKKLDEGL